MPIPEDWHRQTDGQLLVGHVLGWQTVQTPVAGLLRIRIAQTPAQAEKGGVPIQLVLPPEQARKLGEDLVRLADLSQPAPSSKVQ